MTGQQRGEVTGVDFLAERCFGYNKEGMHAEVVNGMDPLAVRDATKRGAKLCREGKGPIFLELWCYRFKGHSLSDRLDEKEDETYRALEELEAWERMDPISTFSKKLIEEDILTEEDVEKLKKEARTRNEEMAQRAAEDESKKRRKVSKAPQKTKTGREGNF